MMNQLIVLGVDVGGTNTDAAVVEYPARKILKSCKVTTTEDFSSGIINTIAKVLDGEQFLISAIMIGTTTFVNAVLQCSESLSKVTVLRLCGPTSLGYPPFINFPPNLKAAIEDEVHLVRGGYEFDGRVLSALDEDEIASIGDRLAKRYFETQQPISVVISGIFSPICPDQEILAKDVLQRCFENAGVKKFYITCSSSIAQIGLLEREGASILNASLRPMAEATVQNLRQRLADINLRCSVYLTQNDGTLISCDDAIKFPIFTFNSGPTNSLRGAYLLTGIDTALVADIGGTSTDVSVLQKGFPRPASSYVEVGGVRTNFRMPDTTSIGLGGGSLVKFEGNKCFVGPKSVGYRLKTESQSFGGKHLVATDIALKLKTTEITGSNPSEVDITENDALTAQKTIVDMLSRLVDKMKSNQEPTPLILVGGGSALIPSSAKIPGISEVVKPEHFDVANAIGATIAQVSAVAESVIDFSVPSSKSELEDLKQRAKSKALESGAVPNTIEVVTDSTHLSYMPGRSMQVKCRAVGDLDLTTKTPWPSELVRKDMNLQITIPPFIEDAKLKQAPELMAKLPVPQLIVDGNRREWIINRDDVHCMAIGAGILGTGGGGSPYTGTLEVLEQIKAGKQIRVIQAADIGDDDYVLSAFYFGAPLIMTEKLGGAKKIADAVLTMQQLIKLRHPRAKLAAVTPVEIGGCNSLAPLFVGAELALPIVDNDFMGRAFPHYNMITPIIYGVDCVPAVLRDEKGNEIILNRLQSLGPHHIESGLSEEFLRSAVVVMGCDGGGSGVFIQREDLMKLGIHRSLSQIWKLGRDILEARRNKTDPLDVIQKTQGGSKLFAGKITDVLRVTEGGYNKGNLLIEGFDEYADYELKIEFQNENLIAYRRGKDSPNYESIATVPDLISLVDVESYQPILTEDLRYGLRVSCLIIPAHPLLKTKEALQIVGPEAFGYKGVEFKPHGAYQLPFSVFENCV